MEIVESIGKLGIAVFGVLFCCSALWSVIRLGAIMHELKQIRTILYKSLIEQRD